MPADYDEMLLAGVFGGDFLVESSARWGHQNYFGLALIGRVVSIPQFFDCLEDRFAFEHHALAAAVRRVVGGAVLVARPVAEVVRADEGKIFFLCAFHHALGECAVADGWEQCQDVDLHVGLVEGN